MRQHLAQAGRFTEAACAQKGQWLLSCGRDGFDLIKRPANDAGRRLDDRRMPARPRHHVLEDTCALRIALQANPLAGVKRRVLQVRFGKHGGLNAHAVAIISPAP